ncbi:nucleotide exchange factor GrpE [Sphaerothrix gracilis]|uniref:nucleotide exchange factor GrpE n=1 Tax=Sphaerothrix gracilis TaxID=3151835 RepID=UPI0031FC6962
MIDEANQMDNSPEATSGAADVEELKEEDGAVEFDFEKNFQSPAASDETAASSTQNDEADTGSSSSAAEQVTALERQVAELKAQLEDRTSQYMRIAADFENFRKRTGKQREENEVQVKCSTIGELLPVVDNFERARSQIKPQSDSEMAIHKSYQSVYKQLVECLKRVGVSPMRAEGQEFDPNLHEAVMREPTAEYPEDTVIEELVRGYILGDRVLRHAMVKVAAPAEVAAASEDNSGDEAE